MGNVDKSWMNLPRHDSRYDDGVNEFLNFAFSMAAVGNRIYCPCKKCKFGRLHLRKDVCDHLIYTGFVEGYTEWHFHGEKFSSKDKSDSVDDEMMDDDIDGLLHDTFGEVAEGRDDMSEGAKKFYELVEEGKQELYQGCKNFSKLSFTIRLYLLKCLHGMSNEAFTDLLSLLKEAFPHANFPKSFNQARKTIRNLGLECKKIHACPNDCMLYWKDHEQSKECHDAINNLQASQGQDGSARDLFDEVMGEEQNGRLRLYGRSVTRKTLKEKGSHSSYCIPDEFVQSIQDSMASKIDKEVQARVDEEVQIRVAQEIESKKESMMQEVLSRIVSQLQLACPSLPINSEMLGTLVPGASIQTTDKT